MSVFFTGYIVALGLIVAIGAQNAWVLSQSMRGNHRMVIALVCILCDAILITLGVYGVNQLKVLIPPLIPLLSWMGVALLLWLAFNAAQRAVKGTGGLQAAKPVRVQNAWQVGVTALAITLLNPHVYLHTVILIGSVGAAQGDKLAFVLGASFASLTWFTMLTGFAPQTAQLICAHQPIGVSMMAVWAPLLCLVAMTLVP